MIKVLHVASFTGNAGDYANNLGFQKIFKEDVKEIQFDNLELREFSHSWGWRERKFDEDFIKFANKYDLVVVGGGNLLILDQVNNKTGVIIDLDIELLDKLKTPILYNRVGFHNFIDNSPLIEKFRPTLNYITSSDNCFLTVRNDGSKGEMKEIYGKDVIEVPDGGYFYNTEKRMPFLQQKLLGINMVSDTVQNLQYGAEKFYRTMSAFCWIFLENYPDYEIVFLPHIYSDLEAVNELLKNIPDKFVRSRIKIAPYGDWERLFEIYAQCQAVMGIRFHANVCAMGMNVPTIGLVHLSERVYHMYNDLKLKNRIFGIGRHANNLYQVLFRKVEETLNNQEEISKIYQQKNKELRQEAKEINKQIKKWLRRP